MKLNLGSGLQAYEAGDGWIHIDIRDFGDNFVWDLEAGLPPHIQPNSVSEIRCHHVLEHLRNLMQIMDRMWEALGPDGILHIWVPNAHHIKAAWSDPTHVRAFTPETFDYWTPPTLSAFPYTNKPWRIIDGPHINGEEGDKWELEIVMQPIKTGGES